MARRAFPSAGIDEDRDGVHRRKVSITFHARIRREKLSITAWRYGAGTVYQADDGRVDVPDLFGRVVRMPTFGVSG